MARPRNQTARRMQLVDSTLKAIHERGIASLRIRDVAEVAGVATGTVHYYFDDLDRLLHEVHSLAADRFYDERLAAIAGVRDAREKLGITLRTGLPRSPEDEIVIALYEIGVYKRGDPIHGLLSSGLYDRQVALYFGILELGQSQGHFREDLEPALDIARNLVALEDAYGLHVIDGNRSLPLERCAALIESYARTATGCATIGDEPTS
jgi:AcrR family transcriptional regulator